MTCLAVCKVRPLGDRLHYWLLFPASVLSSQTVTRASACCDIKHRNSVSFYTQMLTNTSHRSHQENQRWEMGRKTGALTLFVPENI